MKLMFSQLELVWLGSFFGTIFQSYTFVLWLIFLPIQPASLKRTTWFMQTRHITRSNWNPAAHWKLQIPWTNTQRKQGPWVKVRDYLIDWFLIVLFQQNHLTCSSGGNFPPRNPSTGCTGGRLPRHLWGPGPHQRCQATSDVWLLKITLAIFSHRGAGKRVREAESERGPESASPEYEKRYFPKSLGLIFSLINSSKIFIQ
jgi:hypothetical protein